MAEFEKALEEIPMSQGVKNMITVQFQMLATFWILRHSGDFIAHSQMQVSS